MSSGPGGGTQPPADQAEYNAFMNAVDSLVANSTFDMENVSRQASDCDKLAAGIAALQTIYQQYCPIA